MLTPRGLTSLSCGSRTSIGANPNFFQAFRFSCYFLFSHHSYSYFGWNLWEIFILGFLTERSITKSDLSFYCSATVKIWGRDYAPFLFFLSSLDLSFPPSLLLKISGDSLSLGADGSGDLSADADPLSMGPVAMEDVSCWCFALMSSMKSCFLKF